MDLNPVVLSIPIFFLLIGIELIYDAYRARKTGKRLYRWNDGFTNVSCGIIDQVTKVFAEVFVIGVYALAFTWGQSNLGIDMARNGWTYALCFVVTDFSYYWSHRISHEVNLFWTGHVIHHQSEEYNLSVALRQGAFQKVQMFWVYVPMALLGFPPEWFVSCIAFNLLYQFWIHTEAVERMGVFGYIFNTPSHHRVHHGRNPKYIDRNHAGILIVWDKLFGTFQAEEEKPTYGITRPTKTFNPVVAHIQPYVRLWNDVKAVPGWGDRFRFLFKPPGWYPASMGGVQPPPPVAGAQKFDVKLSAGLNGYLWFQYALVIGATSVFLFGLDLFSPLAKGLFLGGVLLALFTMGSLFDRRPYAPTLEWVRQLALLAGGIVFGWVSGQMHIAGIWVTAVMLSLFWLWYVRAQLNPSYA